jgi:steroid 5-alpha reductase family enzyme
MELGAVDPPASAVLLLLLAVWAARLLMDEVDRLSDSGADVPATGA